MRFPFTAGPAGPCVSRFLLSGAVGRSVRAVGRSVRYHLIGAVLLVPTAGLAQQQQDSILKPVVVTASRLEQSLTDTIPHTTVITTREIQESQVVDLPNLLRREAGFEFVQNGGPGTATNIFLRGAEGRQVLILIDGVRVGSATLGTTSIEQVMLDQVERVEIVRGNVSALYGAGAIGGVIQIFTKQGSGAPRFSAQASIGSRHTSRVAAGYGGSIGDTRFNLNVSHFETAGFSAIDPSLAPRANPDQDGYRNESFSGQISHRLTPGHELGLRAYRSAGNTDFDSAFGRPTDRHRIENTLSSYAIYSSNALASFWQSRLTLAEGTEKSHSFTNSAPPTRFDTRNTQLLWQNDFTLAPDHVVTAGFERQQQRVSSTTAYRYTERDVSSGVLAYSGRSGAHHLQASARRDDYSDFGNANTWLVGYGYDLTTRWKVTGLRSSAFSAPTFNQLFFPGFGNPALQPEKSQSSEVGLQYARENHVLRLAQFRTRYQNLIQNVVVATTPFTLRPQNVARARVEGTELSYAGRAAVFDFKASLTVQDPVDETTGAQLRRRGTTFGNLTVNTTISALRLGAELIHGSSRPDNNIRTGSPLTLGSYTVVNFTARHPLGKNAYLAARIENAFDEEYMVAHGFNVPGRGVFVSLGWQP